MTLLRVIHFRVGAVAALLLFAAGCSPQSRIDAVRTHRFAGSAMTLGDAYEQLLVNVVWSQEYVRPEKLIVVRGTLMHSAVALAVFYRQEAPPQVSFFTVAGKRRGSGEFGLFLRREVLLSKVMATPTPVAAGAAVPGVSGHSEPSAPPP